MQAKIISIPHGFFKGAINDICPTIKASAFADNSLVMIPKSRILTPLRTEKGRELRKQGIEVFANRYLAPREDGCSNTITTILKDNLLLTPKIIGYTRSKSGRKSEATYHMNDIANTIHTATGSGGTTDQYVAFQHKALDTVKTLAKDKRGGGDAVMLPNGDIRAYCRKYGTNDSISELQITYDMNESGTITTSSEANKVYGESTEWGIRKLTPREVYRLMGFSEEDIDKMLSATYETKLKDGTMKVKPVPLTAQYKAAGNSICAPVLYDIFKSMFVDEPPKMQPKQHSLFDDF